MDMDKLLRAEIETAILTRRTITFRYTYERDDRREATIRTVRPCWVSPNQENRCNLMRGFCRLRQDMRTFRVDRMELIDARR